MGSRASEYERELKEILQAHPEALRKYSRNLDPIGKAAIELAGRRPFLVLRAAGSLGFDLVALRSEFSFPLEVKASSSDTIRFSSAGGRADRQLKEHTREVDRVGLIVVYAFRRIGARGEEPWRVFIAPSAENGGRLGLLVRRLPRVDKTRDGNAVLRWADGMPLTRFLEIVAFLTDRPGASVG